MKRKVVCAFLAILMLLPMPVMAQAEPNTVLLSYVSGDVDGNWSVDSSDARAIYRVTSGKYGDRLPLAADADQNGAVNTADAYRALCVAVGKIDSVLIHPGAAEVETVIEGSPMDFVCDKHTSKFSDDTRRMPDLWVAQSYDEFKAIYEHSYSRYDYTGLYNEEFFEENALIIWASHLRVNGMVDLEMDRLVKNGNELCIVRKVSMFLNAPYDWFARFFIEVSKEDLAGIDTITFTTEYEYKDWPS